VTGDAASIAAYAFNYDIGNFCAKRACQRDNVGQSRLPLPNTSRKIYFFAEDIKFKTDNFRGAVVSVTHPRGFTGHRCSRIFSH
jgi:hypothetical protein